MSTIEKEQTTENGLHYFNMRTSGNIPTFDRDELKELYVQTHDKREKNVKIIGDAFLQKLINVKLSKKAVAIIMGSVLGVSTFAATQVVGSFEIAKQEAGLLDDTCPTGPDSIYTVLINDELRRKGTHEIIPNRKEFLGKWKESFCEKGNKNPNEFAVAVSTAYENGIKPDEIEGSTLLGRIGVRNEAFSHMLYENVDEAINNLFANGKKGVSR